VFVAFLRQRQHFLGVLLALELLIVCLVALLVLGGLGTGDRAERLLFLLLVVGVCEASMGLALLVAMVRAYGNDLVASVNVHKV